jgi:hypothetical protein
MITHGLMWCLTDKENVFQLAEPGWSCSRNQVLTLENGLLKTNLSVVWPAGAPVTVAVVSLNGPIPSGGFGFTRDSPDKSAENGWKAAGIALIIVSVLVTAAAVLLLILYLRGRRLKRYQGQA